MLATGGQSAGASPASETMRLMSSWPGAAHPAPRQAPEEQRRRHKQRDGDLSLTSTPRNPRSRPPTSPKPLPT